MFVNKELFYTHTHTRKPDAKTQENWFKIFSIHTMGDFLFLTFIRLLTLKIWFIWIKSLKNISSSYNCICFNTLKCRDVTWKGVKLKHIHNSHSSVHNAKCIWLSVYLANLKTDLTTQWRRKDFFFKQSYMPCWKIDSLHATLTLAWPQLSEQVLISLKSNKKIFKNIKEI